MRVKRSEDLELVKRAANGDGDSFAELYARNRQQVYYTALRMCHNADQAEDLTQDIFLHCWRKLSGFRGESKFSTWLHRLAVNIVLMELRKAQSTRRSANTVSLDSGSDQVLSKERGTLSAVPDSGGLRFAQSMAVDAADPRAQCGSPLRIALEAAIEQLPPGYRLMFTLHDIHGYEHTEAAEIVGCSRGNSKSQLFKARQRLRRLINGEATPDGRCRRVAQITDSDVSEMEEAA